jgi:hypothetical protein
MKSLILISAMLAQCPINPPREIAYFSGEVVSKEMVLANYYGKEIKVLVINGYAPRIVERERNGFIVKDYYYNDKIPYKGFPLVYKQSEEAIKTKVESPKMEDAPSVSLEEFERLKKETENLKKDLESLREEQELNIPTLKAVPKSLKGN